MKKEFKGTQGLWKPEYVSGVCIGVGATIIKGFTAMIVNTILPNTDEEYAEQEPNIKADMNLIAAAPKHSPPLLKRREKNVQNVHHLIIINL